MRFAELIIGAFRRIKIFGSFCLQRLPQALVEFPAVSPFNYTFLLNRPLSVPIQSHFEFTLFFLHLCIQRRLIFSQHFLFQFPRHHIIRRFLDTRFLSLKFILKSPNISVMIASNPVILFNKISLNLGYQIAGLFLIIGNHQVVKGLENFCHHVFRVEQAVSAFIVTIRLG